MTTLRQAAAQALEALEAITGVTEMDDVVQINCAITSLRQALEAEQQTTVKVMQAASQPSARGSAMTDAEIVGRMGWRGPGAYMQHHLRRIREIVEEAQRREREACAKVCDDIDVEYGGEDVVATWCSAAIRARSNT